MIGPIQLLAIQFETIDKFKGDITAEMADLIGSGTMRLIDLQFVAKQADGTLVVMQESSLRPREQEAVGSMLKKLMGLSDEVSAEIAPSDAIQLATESFGLGLGDLTALKDSIEPGTALALLLVEHAWAAEFTHAMRAAGGVPILQGFLTREAVMLVGSEMEAALEAQRVMAAAESVETAALLDALVTVVEAEQLKRAVEAETAQLLRSGVSAEVVQALCTAGLLRESDLDAAIGTLFSAGLIEEGTLSQAQSAIE